MPVQHRGKTFFAFQAVAKNMDSLFLKMKLKGNLPLTKNSKTHRPSGQPKMTIALSCNAFFNWG